MYLSSAGLLKSRPMEINFQAIWTWSNTFQCNFDFKCKHLLLWKCIWKCRLQNGGHFVKGSIDILSVLGRVSYMCVRYRGHPSGLDKSLSRIRHQAIISINSEWSIFNWKFVNISNFMPLWPSEAIWPHRSGSTLTQMMASCLIAWNYFLNKYWLIVNGVPWHPPKANLTGNAPDIHS